MNRYFVGKGTRRMGCLLALCGLIAILCAGACAPAVDTAAGAKALAQLDDDWSKAAATRDVDRVASFYAEGAIAYPPNEPVAIGQPAAKKVWATYLSDSTFSISWKTTHSGVSKSGEIGFTAGTYEDSYVGPDGKKVEEQGKYLCVWEKQTDGTWKATHDMWNSDSK